MQEIKKNGTIDWSFKGLRRNSIGCYDVVVKGRKGSQRSTSEVCIGIAQSGVAGALMFDAALEQRGVLTGYNFATHNEREKVGYTTVKIA